MKNCIKMSKNIDPACGERIITMTMSDKPYKSRVSELPQSFNLDYPAA
jgi:hypothetical protein